MADFGEILRSIGDFGLFQKVLLIALCFPYFLQSFLMASFIFIESDPERHCNTDWILRTDPNLTIDEQLNLTLPQEENGIFSKCRMFIPVDWNISDIREFGLNETTACQNGWVYYSTMYTATIVTDFDLVCDKAQFVKMIQAVSMASVLVGTLIFGPFAESFGRKRAVQIPAVIAGTSALAISFCPNVHLYIVCVIIMSFGSGAYLVNSVILCTEWTGPSKRSWGACLAQIFVAVGQCVVAGVIYAIRNWRLVQLITASLLSVLIIYIWFIPESARWLLSKGRTDEAKQLIVKAAVINKRAVPDFLPDQLHVKDVENKRGITVIFKSQILTKYFFIITLAWFSSNLANYSLYFNMENLGLNIFLTQLLFGAIEIPALVLCIWLLEVFGRKLLLTATLLIGGVSSMVILAVPEGIAVTALATLSRFFVTTAGPLCNVYIQEVFPTSVRQTATALGALFGKSGGLLAPLLNILAKYHSFIPITVFSSIALLSGALGLLLPETRRKELPESDEDVENNRHGTVTHTTSSPDLTATKL